MIVEPIDAKQAEEGQMVAVFAPLENEFYLGMVTKVSDDGNSITVITKELGKKRFGNDGWRYEQEFQHAHRLIEASARVRTLIHRRELIGKFRDIIPEQEDTIVLETMMKAYNVGKALVVEDKEIYGRPTTGESSFATDV